MRLPQGFQAGAVRAGIKPSGNPDLALLHAEAPLAWAYVATTNRAAAPCVLRGRALLASEAPLRALVANAGNANAATGEAGVAADLRMAELAAERLGVRPDEVLTASTGVIGVPLPVDRIATALPALVLGPDADSFAEAILTTDTRTKLAEATLPGGARVVGVAKGSGMIHPNMATMFGFLFTDARVDQAELRARWPEVVRGTFNQVTVDGDTSTNDMAAIFASSLAGPVSPELFWDAVAAVARDLARQIAADGEGATKLISVRVVGAASLADARRAARAVAGSLLWKAAVYGNDPNWGRILAALGYSGALLDAGRVRIELEGIPLYDGAPLPFDHGEAVRAMQRAEVRVLADLRQGDYEAEAWGSDLTEGYVRINAEYTT